MKKIYPFHMKTKELVMLTVSAVLMACAFENINLDIFVWISFIPFLIVIEDKSLKDAFKCGFFTGILFYVLTIYWLIYTISYYGKINIVLSILIFLLLVLYMAALFGLFALLHCQLKKRFDLIFVAPLIWVMLEYIIRTYFLSGFPWVLLGYSLYRRPVMTQFADITGVYGLSFLIVLVNMALFRLYQYFVKERKRHYVAEVGIALIILVIAIGYGVRTLKSGIINTENPLEVGLLQGNIDQDLKWDKDHKDETMNIYFDLTNDAAEKIRSDSKVPRLIVWPETATPFYMQNETFYRGKMLKLANSTGSYILTGSLSFDFASEDKDIEDYSLYNSAFLLSPDMKILDRYDKIHLVPFGEYVPISKVLFFVNKITEGIGDFTSGKKAKNLLMNDHDIRLGVLICYESIFPNLVRNFVDKGADVLVNITNDAWFGDTSAPYQQLSMAALRAVENKRYLIRSANTGISGIIDPFGKVISATDIFTKDHLTGEVYKVDKKTFYSEHGDIFSQLVSVVFFLLLALSFKKSAKQTDK